MAPSTRRGKGKSALWLREHVGHDDAGCLIWPFYRLPNGYGQLGFEGRMVYAHRMMCELTHGACPDGHEAAHECGNGALGCVHPKHLFWRTKSQNRLDALRHGTGVIKRTGNAGSLTDEQVAEIRSLQGRMLQVDIAARFNISPPRVRAIFTNKIYREDRKTKNWTPEEDAKLIELMKGGASYAEAGKALGRNVSGRAHRLGVRSTWDPHAPRGPKSAPRSP